MSTTETHFRDSRYWDNQFSGDPESSIAPGHGDAESGPPEYAQTSLPIFGLFILYVVYWYLQANYRYPSLGAIRFEFLLGAVLSALALFKIFMSKDNVGTSLFGWSIAFVALMGVMTLATIDPVTSQDVFINRVFKLLMMGVFIYAFVSNPITLRWFLIGWLFAFAKMAQEGVVGFVTGNLVWENQGTMRLHGSTPNYKHPNSFSGTQLATLPFLYFLFPHAPRIFQLAILAQTIGALTVVLTTGSRTGYVALAAGLLLLVWKSRSKLKAAIILGLIVVLIEPYIPQDYKERAETIFTQEDEFGASIDTRKQIIDDAVEIFEANMAGVGLGAFPSARKKRFERHQETHNLYLQILTELGVQGLLLFAAVIISCFNQLFKLIQLARSNLANLKQLSANNQELEQHRADLRIIMATCFAITGFLVLRLAVGVFGHDLYEIYWWFAIGLTIALARIMATATRRTDWFVQNLASNQAAVDEEDVQAGGAFAGQY